MKERRRITQGISQKLKNRGFTVTVIGDLENSKQGSLGFAYVGQSHGQVESALAEGMYLFNELVVVQTDQDVFDYADLEITDPAPGDLEEGKYDDE